MTQRAIGSVGATVIWLQTGIWLFVALTPLADPWSICLTIFFAAIALLWGRAAIVCWRGQVWSKSDAVGWNLASTMATLLVCPSTR
jgi:hypothetical protein